MHPHMRDYYHEAQAEHEKKILELQTAYNHGNRYYRVDKGKFEFFIDATEPYLTTIEEGLKKHWG